MLHFVIPMRCTGRFDLEVCMKYRIISIWIVVMMVSPYVLYALGVRSLIALLVFWEISSAVAIIDTLHKIIFGNYFGYDK